MIYLTAEELLVAARRVAGDLAVRDEQARVNAAMADHARSQMVAWRLVGTLSVDVMAAQTLVRFGTGI